MRKPGYCPEWFDIKNYDICKEYSRSAWIAALLLRDSAANPDFYGDKSEAADRIVDLASRERLEGLHSRWSEEEYYGMAATSEAVLYDFTEVYSWIRTNQGEIINEISGLLKWSEEIDESWINLTIGEDFPNVDKNFFTPLGEWKPSKDSSESAPLLVRCDLMFSDEQIIDDLKKVLAKARTRMAANPGKAFSDVALQEWAEWKLLAYFDLTVWNEITGAGLTKVQIGNLLYPDELDFDPTQRVSRTMPDKLQKVMSGLRQIHRGVKV
ncbi:DUF6387 family protein [Crenobacter sp. SG2305]|uniref:DUF6387 family protein n=1 Tax=Crenobacter oryzisoli TaxID=3056844 RepID=UPI0025AB40AB|nr:DUF6387 family protein [Crenobacter sp. SG2305]MDN0085417.1 DUF6387 family protein [Crenobacter sp. SG2305]